MKKISLAAFCCVIFFGLLLAPAAGMNAYGAKPTSPPGGGNGGGGGNGNGNGNGGVGNGNGNGNASPQIITEVQRLNFGTFAVRSNNMQPGSITVTPDGDVYTDGNIVLGDGAQRGEYQFSGLPANVTFYLGVDMPQSSMQGGVVLTSSLPGTLGGGGPTLALTDLTISNGGTMTSDNQGDATLYIGGTLRTTGTGQRYDGGLYLGSYTITVFY